MKEFKNWPDDKYTPIDAASEIGEEEIAAATEALVDQAVSAAVPENSNIQSLNFSTALEDVVSINLTVVTKNGKALQSAKIGEDELEIRKLSKNRYLVVIPNIMAQQLGNRYTVVLNADGDDAEITVSALSYAYGILTSSAYANNTVAKQAATAIYQYYSAALGYIGSRTRR